MTPRGAMLNQCTQPVQVTDPTEDTQVNPQGCGPLVGGTAIIYRIFPQFPDKPPITYDTLQYTSTCLQHLQHDYHDSQ